MLAEIDRDLGAHPPVGMRHRLFGRHALHRFGRMLEERAAAGGKDDALDGAALGRIEALEDRVVLAVDGQQGGAAALDPRP